MTTEEKCKNPKCECESCSCDDCSCSDDKPCECCEEELNNVMQCNERTLAGYKRNLQGTKNISGQVGVVSHNNGVRIVLDNNFTDWNPNKNITIKGNVT